MLLSFALGDANFLRRPCTFLFFCVDFFALGSKRKPHFQWNIGCVGSLALGLCVRHVHFIFFVLISFVSGTQRKPLFWWNMGFSDSLTTDHDLCWQPVKGSDTCGSAQWIEAINFIFYFPNLNPF